MNAARHAYRGFTLIELMVAMAIIGVLAAIAIPQYDSYVMRGRIADGISMLSELQVRQEQYYQDNRAYVSGMSPRATSEYWTGTCTTANVNQTFSCSVTPKAGSSIGYVFSVDQAGTKLTAATATPISGWTVPSPASCWVRTKAGSC